MDLCQSDRNARDLLETRSLANRLRSGFLVFLNSDFLIYKKSGTSVPLFGWRELYPFARKNTPSQNRIKRIFHPRRSPSPTIRDPTSVTPPIKSATKTIAPQRNGRNSFFINSIIKPPFLLIF